MRAVASLLTGITLLLCSSISFADESDDCASGGTVHVCAERESGHALRGGGGSYLFARTARGSVPDESFGGEVAYGYRFKSGLVPEGVLFGFPDFSGGAVGIRYTGALTRWAEPWVDVHAGGARLNPSRGVLTFDGSVGVEFPLLRTESVGRFGLALGLRTGYGFDPLGPSARRDVAWLQPFTGLTWLSL